MSQRCGATSVVILVRRWTEKAQATSKLNGVRSASAAVGQGCEPGMAKCSVVEETAPHLGFNAVSLNGIKILIILMPTVYSILKNNGVDQTQKVYL